MGARAAASQVGTNRQGSAGTGAPPSSAAQPAAQPPRNQPPAARPPAAATAGGAGARPPAGAPTGKPAPAASTPARASSPANATTAQKIAGGTEVYNKQRAAGDFKAASETGKQVFSAAQPKLAAAAAERERTRGTSATTNPLMKDFKSRLPAPDPAPTTTSSTSSPFTNTAAAKSAVTAATKPAPAPKPTPAATGSKKPGSIVSHYDPFDFVIGHLLDEGYADSEESALAIMANMSEEWKDSIMEMEYNKKRPLEARPLEARPLEARPTRSLQSNTKPDMSTPQDKIDAKRIKNTPLGARLTSPGGPIRNPGPATGPNGFLNRNK